MIWLLLLSLRLILQGLFWLFVNSKFQFIGKPLKNHNEVMFSMVIASCVSSRIEVLTIKASSKCLKDTNACMVLKGKGHLKLAWKALAFKGGNSLMSFPSAPKSLPLVRVSTNGLLPCYTRNKTPCRCFPQRGRAFLSSLGFLSGSWNPSKATSHYDIAQSKAQHRNCGLSCQSWPCPKGMIGIVLVKHTFIWVNSVDLQMLAVKFPDVLCRDMNKIWRPNFTFLNRGGFEDGQIAALVSAFPPIKSTKNSFAGNGSVKLMTLLIIRTFSTMV